MKNIIKNISLCGCLVAGMGLTSCDDFLTITPTSSIVEEEFWQDKNDLENAVGGCYKSFAGEDVIKKIIYWGEMRGDNFERSSGVSSTGQIANIMNANLLPTYDIFNWTSLYNVINNCNKVLDHGKDVIKNDESFSRGDWEPIQAEMITLRALCHFTLVRTFGEIPYVTKDYNNDSQELRQPQVTQLAVLDSIISDLESIKGVAMTEYGNKSYNKGRITKKAVLALLADVYLWRASYKAGHCHPFINREIPSYNKLYTDGKAVLEDDNRPYGTTALEDYEKCVECCDQIISIANEEKLKYIKDHRLNVGGVALKMTLEDLLEQNVVTATSSDVTTLLYIYNSSSEDAYEKIFDDGNSDESIFEIQYDGVTYKNTGMTGRYWDFVNNKGGELTAATPLFETVTENPNALIPTSVFSKRDYRRWTTVRFTSTGQTSFDLIKYIANSVTLSSSGVTGASMAMLKDNSTVSSATYSLRSDNNNDANWIVYRMSEIYLMKAEALSQISGDEDNLKTAFSYVREVFKRSNPYAYSSANNLINSDTLKFDVFKTQEGIESLVMAERQREFVCEGKRWFDLVRYAQRKGSTEKMLNILTRKYSSGANAVRAKLADMQSLFCPVYDSELKNNTWLYQNGSWKTTESSGRTDNL